MSACSRPELRWVNFIRCQPTILGCRPGCRRSAAQVRQIQAQFLAGMKHARLHRADRTLGDGRISSSEWPI